MILVISLSPHGPCVGRVSGGESWRELQYKQVQQTRTRSLDRISLFELQHVVYNAPTR